MLLKTVDPRFLFFDDMLQRKLQAVWPVCEAHNAFGVFYNHGNPWRVFIQIPPIHITLHAHLFTVTFAVSSNVFVDSECLRE